MKLYTMPHDNFGGIDLHTKKICACILDRHGETVFHKNLDTEPDIFLKILQPFREDVAVGVKCVFTWCLLAGLCD